MVLRDRDIREPLFDFLEERYGKCRIIEEKTIGHSRADLVMVLPNQLVGIEIKSDADNYARLKRQIKDYDQYFDSNVIVVGSTHAMHVDQHVPDWWGIISVEIEDGDFDFYVIRERKENPKRDLKKKLMLLWKTELINILKRQRMAFYGERSKAFMREKLFYRVPERILQMEISEELFERDYTLAPNMEEK